MCCLPKFALAACVLVCGSWQMQGQVYPVPIRGGDIIARRHILINQFFPGPPNQTPPFDPMNTYNIETDIRVFQGDYVGAAPANGGAGGSVSAPAHGTFVEI